MANTRQHQVHEQKLEQLVKSMPFYIVEYVDNKLDTRSPSTLLNYVLDYKLFLEWLIAEGIAEDKHIKDIPLSVLEKLKLVEAQSFIKFLERRNIPINKKETKKAEKVSVNRKISALRSLFKYLRTQTENDEDEPYFYRNVMLKIEVNKVKETLGARASRISTKIFHNDEDARFLEFVKHNYERELPEKSRKLIYFKRDKERDFAILSLFLGSGIRVNELSNLRLRDLDFEEKKLHVLRKGGKKDVVAVSPPSMQDIKDYLAVRSERYRGSNDDAAYVFLTRVNDGATPLSNRAIEALVKKYTKAFKSNKSMSPHKLRHIYGTNLMEQSGDIHLLMTQLGHTSTTTAALYTNPEQEKAKKAAKLLGDRRTNYCEKD
ncbi:tyrosine recombinase XerS [Peribacillus frigoritolerans]|uniref:tyrosine recombinase XerS n=1 Tax=Peribacillus frigoritolerans TaxID=450367 RepID=UPI002E212826|nr:tyrosine recombinase XerS [Peribacillus frigoritolerans]MED4697242.1 tyrosine recombinase XerS [Peribacillus frigoritolerans]